MKLTLCLSASLLALLALPAGLRAADHDAPDNPYSDVDPDGVPLAVTQQQDGQKHELSEAELKQRAEEEDRQRNWLLLEYEQQFRHSSKDYSDNDQTLKMYLQLSLHKDFADVAVPTSSDSNTQPNADPDANSAPAPSLHASQNGMALRSDTAPVNRSFMPLLSAMNSSAASAATQPFYAAAYSAALPPSLAPTSALDAPPAPATSEPAPSPAPTSLPTSPTDTVDMETPGMIADKTDPLPGTPNLDLDSLPDPNSNNAQDQQQPPQLAKLPQAMDAALLHEELSAKLDPTKNAQAKAMSQQAAPTPAPAALNTPPPPETPMPISHQPMLSPVHPPIPDPFDILNR